MRIVDIREKTVALSSSMRNASIGFQGMTASAVAMVSDVRRGGKHVIGLAVDSVGRYGHGGLLRERLIPRILAAGTQDYADEKQGGPDPFKVWDIAMRDEKPGGHGERPGAVGLIDAAAWDLAAKLQDKPLWGMLAEESGIPKVRVYASGGHYHEDDDLARRGEEIRSCLDLGYRTIKIKAGGVPIAQDLRRLDCALDALGGAGGIAVDLFGEIEFGTCD